MPAKEYSLQIDWQTTGYDWLSNERGLIISLLKDRDPNLYIARWQPNTPPQQMELVPIVVELGDDVLPRLGNSGKLLAWARKIHKRQVDKKPGEKDSWQFMLADFDAAKLVMEVPAPPPGQQIEPLAEIAKRNTRNRRSISLPGEPGSISWDSKGKRWLVVTQDGMRWIKEEQGKLAATKVADLKWGQIALRPISAAVSPQGNKIAVAAELATPQVYEKTQAKVMSLIFLWDGQSSTVQPLYEPSLNGLPRYTFPAAGSPWARIHGDVKKFGLEGMADPAFFVAQKPTQGAAKETPPKRP